MTHSDVTGHIESISPFIAFLRHDKQNQLESGNTKSFSILSPIQGNYAILYHLTLQSKV